MNENLTGKDAFDGSLLFEQGDFDARTGRAAFEEAILDGLRRKPYFDADACAPRSDCLARRPCPLCGGEAKAPAFALHGFEHVTCRDCGFLHVDPILSPEAMRQHYEEENQWTGVMLNPVEQMVNRRMYRYTMERIRGHMADPNPILDIGAGTGLFVQTACEDGYEASGVELNNRMLQRARELGIDMFSASLADLARGRRYGLVTIWFVLEHVPDPRGFLAEAAALLRDDGALFLAVPNIDALATRLMGRDAPLFGGNSHINFFNQDSLDRLARSLGLRPVHAETYVTQLNNIRNHFRRLGEWAEGGLGVFLDGLTPEAIHGNMMGSMLCGLYVRATGE